MELANDLSYGVRTIRSRRREKEHKMAVEGSDDLMAACDENYNYLFANKAYLKYYQLGRDEVVGAPLEKVIGKEAFENTVKPHVDRCLEGEAVKYEMTRNFPGLGDRYLSVYYYPLQDEKGEIRGVVAVLRDITDRKKSEEREAFLETLLGQDMRNKLGVSMGFLELLEEADLPEEYRPYLGKAMDSIGKGFDLVELAEEVRKAKHVEVEEINLCEVLENAVEECEGLVKEKGVEIELDSEKRRNVRAGYPLKKAFLHMFRTSIYKSSCSKMRVLDEERNEEVVVRVEDDGNKIPDAVKEKISEGTYTGETSGIGGAIYSAVGEIVRSFGGSIEVKDSELGGARFDVHLKKT